MTLHPRESSITWIRELSEQGDVVFRFGRSGDRLVGEWPRIARLTCERDGSRPRLRRHPAATAGAFAKLQGTVRVLLADLRGGLGIHASAVALGSEAVLILGDAGAGKSTCAAELCTNHGGRLLADDTALVELRGGEPTVAPSEQAFCLSRQSCESVKLRAGRATLRYGGKSLIRPRLVARESRPLRLAALLRFDDTVEQAQRRPLVGNAAASSVLRALFRFDVGDAQARRRELDTVLDIYERVPFIEIVRPRSAPSVSHVLLEALRYGSPNGETRGR